jgi:hypothetical protein
LKNNFSPEYSAFLFHFLISKFWRNLNPPKNNSKNFTLEKPKFPPFFVEKWRNVSRKKKDTEFRDFLKGFSSFCNSIFYFGAVFGGSVKPKGQDFAGIRTPALTKDPPLTEPRVRKNPRKPFLGCSQLMLNHFLLNLIFGLKAISLFLKEKMHS